ncbi:uncharacterized protein LOC142982897 [Anticarsia gemmatalis]|uniref:uncharacterized protein LOC142982897 n=1 Tax=Anticarsia gemmatalis TaxID=129554 RepID=UPI003F75E26F
MDVKLTVLVLFVIAVCFQHADAEFFYNRPSPKAEELKQMGLKCIPGRTTIKISEMNIQPQVEQSDSEELRRKSRRHIGFNSNPDDERCSVCVCAASGLFEYCKKRPALNVNECMIMEAITKQTQKGDPYEHLKSLSYRIRRVGDYNYEPAQNEGVPNQAAKCVPFVSVYSDCTDYTRCSGCTKCLCGGDGLWQCHSVKSCGDESDEMQLDDMAFELALDKLDTEMKYPKKKSDTVDEASLAPQPGSLDEKKKMMSDSESDELLGYVVAIPRKEH